MEDVLGEDQRKQIENWAKTLTLSPLSRDTVVDVVQKYMEDFWQNKIYSPPEKYKIYPFGRNSIHYIYDASQRDLRKTIRLLYDQIEEYREAGEIRIIRTFFENDSSHSVMI